MKASVHNMDRITVIATVDEFVEYLIKINPTVIASENVCSYIIKWSPERLLHLLKSEFNKPSVYDLELINYATKRVVLIDQVTKRDKSDAEYHKDDLYYLILVAYRDRK